MPKCRAMQFGELIRPEEQEADSSRDSIEKCLMNSETFCSEVRLGAECCSGYNGGLLVMKSRVRDPCKLKSLTTFQAP